MIVKSFVEHALGVNKNINKKMFLKFTKKIKISFL
jgi:hypothetical protein